MTDKIRIKKPKQLTNDLIKKLKVGNVNPLDRRKIKHQQKIYDGTGLFVQISKTGKKSFRFRYRDKDKKQIVVTLGDFDENGDGINSFTLEQAQAGYKKYMHLRKNENIDPKDLLQREEKARLHVQELSQYTFEVAASDWLNKQDDFTPLHKKKVMQAFVRDVYPIIKNKSMNAVDRADILKIADNITGRGAKDTARRVISWLERIFDEALFHKKIDSDPTSGIKKRLPKPQRGQFKAVIDPKKLQEVLLLMEQARGEPTTRAALRLLPYLFVRSMELRYMRWENLDLESGLWSLKKAKKKSRTISDDNSVKEFDYVVPLSKQAIEILVNLKPYTRGSAFVLPGVDTITSPISSGTLGHNMKKSLGITETTPHGFRGTFKTLAKDKLDATKEATEYCLSHSPDFDPYGYYRGQCLSERRALMQVWADYLDQLKADTVDLRGLRAKFAELKEFYQDQSD